MTAAPFSQAASSLVLDRGYLPLLGGLKTTVREKASRRLSPRSTCWNKKQNDKRVNEVNVVGVVTLRIVTPQVTDPLIVRRLFGIVVKISIRISSHLFAESLVHAMCM